jgi:hypothetical protein
MISSSSTQISSISKATASIINKKKEFGILCQLLAYNNRFREIVDPAHFIHIIRDGQRKTKGGPGQQLSVAYQNTAGASLKQQY